MHDHFADWYRPCTTGTETSPTEDLLQKRWTGVVKLAEGSVEQVLQFVRIVLQKRSVPEKFMAAFRAAFRDADLTFQMSGNDLEVSVLAGAVVCRIMAEGGSQADSVAIGLICATTILPNPPPWVAPFTAFAHRYLDDRLSALRSVRAISRPQFSQKSLKPQIDTFVTRIAENSAGPTSEAARAFGEALLQELSSTTKATSEAIAELERQSRLRKEESDIHWWITTAVSRDLGVSFKELRALAASVVAGKELASLVSPPGVLPARSLLQGVIPPPTGKGAAGKVIDLIAAVNATPRAWRQSVADTLAIDRVADLAPVLAAIKQSLTTDGAAEWTAAYKKAAGLKSDVLLDPTDLGLQVHRECLLTKLVMEA